MNQPNVVTETVNEAGVASEPGGKELGTAARAQMIEQLAMVRGKLDAVIDGTHPGTRSAVVILTDNDPDAPPETKGTSVDVHLMGDLDDIAYGVEASLAALGNIFKQEMSSVPTLQALPDLIAGMQAVQFFHSRRNATTTEQRVVRADKYPLEGTETNG